MVRTLILASGSQTRATLLRNAGVDFEQHEARIDEVALRQAMQAECAAPRDIADALADMKARKISARMGQAMVIGCDQVLAFNGCILAKPQTLDEARQQLLALRGQTHQLLSAAVIHEAGTPVWRYVGVARLTMRAFTNRYLDVYLDRNWDRIRRSVGGYRIEEEGIRLFARIDGEYFCVLGLPLLEILAYLGQREMIEK